jgi:hypothetical protein
MQNKATTMKSTKELSKFNVTTTLKDFLEKYKFLASSRKFVECEELLNGANPHDKAGKDLVNRCKLDFYIACGKLTLAQEELEKGEILKNKIRSDYLLQLKLARAMAMFDINNSEIHENKLLKLFEINKNDSSMIHEVANYSNDRGYKLEASRLYSIGMLINKNDMLEYDYGRHLLSCGKVKFGIQKYRKRFYMKSINTTLHPDRVNCVSAEEIQNYIDVSKIIYVIGEQGIGDEIRQLMLAISCAKLLNKKIIYFCQERINKYIKTEFIEIKKYSEYDNQKCIFGFDLICVFQDDIESISPEINSYELTLDKSIRISNKNKNYGVVFSSATRNNWGQMMKVISPEIDEIMKIIDEREPGDIYSLQYRFEDFNLTFKKETNILHSKEIDYINDWPKLWEISKNTLMIIGPDSSQTIITSLAAKNTIMLTLVQAEPLYLGLKVDPFIKNTKLVDLDTIRKYKRNEKFKFDLNSIINSY